MSTCGPSREWPWFRPESSGRQGAITSASSRPSGGAGSKRTCGRSGGPSDGSRLRARSSQAAFRRSELPAGGEEAGLRRLDRWLRRGLARYAELHDDLAADGTSRLSPYLHFGCLSPREVVERATGKPGAELFLRQLAWRDFFHQLLAARPDAQQEDYRPRGDRWNDDAEGLAAWKEGRTGLPLVDAGL